MRTVIATDGSLTADDVLAHVTALAGTDEVIVLTIVEIPRALLGDIRRVYGASDAAPVDSDAEYVANTKEDNAPSGWPGDDTIIDRYLADQGEQRAGPLAADLRNAGLTVSVDVRESEDAASAVLTALAEYSPGVVVAAATGRGLFQGLLGSTSTKLMRLSPCPVLLIRG
ncbi:MAG: universal stress protein [Acidimicrobiia bacterium]|nr:universal stress protein [Acidimicrobiia bacterium]